MDCSKWILGLMRPKMVDEVVHHGKAIGYVMAVSEEEVGMLPWNFGFVEERSMKVVADQGHTKLGLSPINHMCKVVIILEGFWLGKEKRFLTAGPVPNWKQWPLIFPVGVETPGAGAGGGADTKWAKSSACCAA